MCNFVSVFFRCFLFVVVLLRFMVVLNMNVKFIFNGVFVVLLMIFVIMVFFKVVFFFIIVVVFKGFFIQMGDCRKYWRINRIDFVIWFFIIVSVVFFDIDFGFGIGVIVFLIIVVFQIQFVCGYRFGRIIKDGVIVEYKRYFEIIEDIGVKVFCF